MVGGAISGYCSTGKVNNPIIPTTTIEIEITADRMGRSIKVLKFIFFLVLFYFNRSTFTQQAYAFRYNDIPLFQSIVHDIFLSSIYTGHTNRS